LNNTLQNLRLQSAFWIRRCNPSTRDLPRCTVQGNGGVAIDIEKATDPAVVAAAMD